MNPNNIVSLPAASNLTGQEYKVVTITSGGCDLCTAAGNPIGTLIRAMPFQEDGTYAGKAVTVQLKEGSIHFAMIGNSSAAITPGTLFQLDPATGNQGKLIPGGNLAICNDAFQAADGAIVRVIFL